MTCDSGPASTARAATSWSTVGSARAARISVDARTDWLRLDTIAPSLPPSPVAGRVRLSIDPNPPGEPARHVQADLEPVTLAGVAIPGFRLEGELEDDAFRITDLHAPHVGGDIDASGRIGFDGSLDVHARARLPDIGRDPNVRRAAPGAHGAVDAVLNLSADAGFDHPRYRGRVTVRGLRYGSVRASRITLHGRGAGTLPTPTIDVDGDAEGLRVGALTLGEAQVSVDGGPAGYDVDLRSHDAASGTQTVVRGRVTHAGDTWRLQAPELLVDLGTGAWRGHGDIRLRPGQSIELAPLALAQGDQRIVAEGTYRMHGDDSIDVQAMNLDLADLTPLAPTTLEGLGGRLDAQLTLRGDVDRRPQGRLTARVRSGTYSGLRDVGGRVDLSLRGNTLDTDVRLDLGEAGELVAQGPIHVPPAALRDPSRLVDEARFEGVRVSAADFDVRPLLSVLGASGVELSGHLTTDAELTGTLRDPGVRDAVVVLDRVVFRDWDPMRLKMRVEFLDERLALRNVWLADDAGELLTAEVDVPVPVDDMPRDLAGFWSLVHTSPWQLSLRLPQRRLDTWPDPLADYVPGGLSTSASLTAANRDGRITADFDAVARFMEAPVEAPCAATLRPMATLHGRLEDDVVTGTVSGFLGGRRAVLDAELAAVLPFDDWVRQGGLDEFPSTEVVARLTGAEMESVPWLCTYGHGPINASLTAKDLLTDSAVVGTVIDMPRLQIWERAGERGEARLSDGYRVHVRAGSSPERDALTACAILGRAGTEGTPGAECREVPRPATGELVSRVRVPVRWVPGHIVPEYVQDGVIRSWTGLEDVHIAPVLTFIPGIVTGDAVMNGDVRVEGPWETLQLDGELAMRDGTLQIEGLGQHLREIEGRVELHGDEAVFPESSPLQARDGGGRATLDGSVGFQGIVPRRLDLNVRASDFPIRREGMVLAWLTGHAAITGSIEDTGTDSRITTDSFVVRLPDQSAGDLQPLDPNPDILIVGRPRPAPPTERADAYEVAIHIDASRPFWVRRSDFAAQVTANIRASYRDPILHVGGQAEIHRGTFEIFGKRFELQPDSTLIFDPESDDLNPNVSISAVYDVPGRRGATVTVRVEGTLSEPRLSFESTETSDRAEIIALLVSGGRRDTGTAERQASEQAASFLAGLTAGILTLGLRQEFGNVIPVLAIESEGLAGTRVRVGFNAEDLIPDFLRDFVTGAYVEGFVTANAGQSSGQTAGPGGIGGGVTVEFTLPDGFLVRGTYVPVNNGSLDVLYEP